jgi:PHD/YefM family antitoxin component YafN of YafNO toxin-antitoxin module
MLIIQDYIPVTKAKSKLLDIIRKIESSDDTVAITKNGVRKTAFRKRFF